MDKPTAMLRILILEDIQLDAELIVREVRRMLPDCQFLRVENQSGFYAALESFQPDVILSDYQLPQFDGLAALRWAIDHAPDTPVIIVTGSINEETAVECMKAGACDYVIKEHIKRLGLAVINAIEQKRLLRERKRADTQLKEKFAELECFNKLTVGRELRMIELKQEVNALLNANGQPDKYKIVHDP